MVHVEGAVLAPARELVIPDEVVASKDLTSRTSLGRDGIPIGIVKGVLGRLNGVPLLPVRRSDLTKFARVECDGCIGRIAQAWVVDGRAKIQQPSRLCEAIQLGGSWRSNRQETGEGQRMYHRSATRVPKIY